MSDRAQVSSIRPGGQAMKACHTSAAAFGTETVTNGTLSRQLELVSLLLVPWLSAAVNPELTTIRSRSLWGGTLLRRSLSWSRSLSA